MELEAEKKNFHHPYSPYDIQLQFMRALYTCIEEGKVGIFESPTGWYRLLLIPFAVADGMVTGTVSFSPL